MICYDENVIFFFLRSLPNFITNTPEDTLKIGDFPSVPLLIGVMNNEVGGAIFGDYKTEIENKLRTVPNFVNEHLIPTLQNTVSNFGNISRFTPETFNKYFNIFNTRNNSAHIAKIAEAMGDSLYNVPAFLTANHWAKKSESFLYSFDHKKTRKCGKTFLSGLPIVKAKHASDGIQISHCIFKYIKYTIMHFMDIFFIIAIISHGDDLGYIFKENTIFGEPTHCIEELNEENERVENIFTNLIAEFAKSGKPNITFSSQNDTLFPNIFPKFSDEINPFISISSTPRIIEQFR